jgi:polyprenyl-phospho-N-acetylgalactosaminyl synthase
MNTNTFVLVPFYNEKATLARVAQELLEEFANVIFVDDGSRDGSAEELTGTDAVLLSFPFNLGKGAALQAAIEYALAQQEAKYLLTFDADGQHQLKDAISLVRRIEEGDADVVLGSRFLSKDDAGNVPLLKRGLLKAAAVASTTSSGVRLTDAHNGLRIFTREAAEKLNLTQPGFGYASEIVERIREHGMRYTEIPVTVLYTDYSRQKGQPILNSVNIVFDMLVRPRRDR